MEREEEPITVTCHGQGSVSCIGTITHGHTGREVDGNEGDALVARWATCATREELLAHDACQRFVSLLPTAALITNDISLFRGRLIDNGSCPVSEDMGPPPPDKVRRGGRYNQCGQSVLYLCDSEEGVRREIREELGVLYVQRFRLPAHEINTADFTGLPRDSFLTAVFGKAEEFEADGRDLHGYVFSQVIAELVSAHFGGMRVPGVWGDRMTRYNNIIIFHPHPIWQTWLEPKSAPYRLK